MYIHNKRGGLQKRMSAFGFDWCFDDAFGFKDARSSGCLLIVGWAWEVLAAWYGIITVTWFEAVFNTLAFW